MEWLKKLIIGGLILVIAGAGGLLLLDEVIMPAYTNYKEAITVPDVTKISLKEAKKRLREYGLQVEVADRRTHSAYPVNYVIDQNPEPQSLVKPHRKIYLTVNKAKRSRVIVPEITDLSLRNAKIQLRNYGLKVGAISYETGRFKNTVLRQSIEAGQEVPKGTIVDIAVSNGLGGRQVKIPDLVGMRLSKAQVKLVQAGLRVGPIRFQPTKKMKPNRIISYSPSDPDSLTQGQVVRFVVSERFEVKEAQESGAVFADSTEAAQIDTTNKENDNLN